MAKSLFEGLSPKSFWLGATGAAVLVCAGLAGATVTLAASASHAAGSGSDLAPPDGRVLTLVDAPAPPLTMPEAATDRLAVLSDVPADLAYDKDLQGSLEAAQVRAADDAETRQAALDTAAFQRQEAQIQAQIDAAGRYPYAGDSQPFEGQRSSAADPAAAAAGDTRPPADSPSI